MKNDLLSKSAGDEMAEAGAAGAAGADGSAQPHGAAKTTFVYLGVVVANDTIYRLNGLGRRTGVLGPLAGATAEVTDGTSRNRLPCVGAVPGALTKKTSAAAFVVTAGGGLARHKLAGAIPVRQAQAQTIKFNALVRRSAVSLASGG